MASAARDTITHTPFIVQNEILLPDSDILELVENEFANIVDVLLTSAYKNFNKKNKNAKLVIVGGKAIEKMGNVLTAEKSFDWDTHIVNISLGGHTNSFKVIKMLAKILNNNITRFPLNLYFINNTIERINTIMAKQGMMYLIQPYNMDNLIAVSNRIFTGGKRGHTISISLSLFIEDIQTHNVTREKLAINDLVSDTSLPIAGKSMKEHDLYNVGGLYYAPFENIVVGLLDMGTRYNYRKADKCIKRLETIRTALRDMSGFNCDYKLYLLQRADKVSQFIRDNINAIDRNLIDSGIKYDTDKYGECPVGSVQIVSPDGFCRDPTYIARAETIVREIELVLADGEYDLDRLLEDCDSNTILSTIVPSDIQIVADDAIELLEQETPPGLSLDKIDEWQTERIQNILETPNFDNQFPDFITFVNDSVVHIEGDGNDIRELVYEYTKGSSDLNTPLLMYGMTKNRLYLSKYWFRSRMTVENTRNIIEQSIQNYHTSGIPNRYHGRTIRLYKCSRFFNLHTDGRVTPDIEVGDKIYQHALNSTSYKKYMNKYHKFIEIGLPFFVYEIEIDASDPKYIVIDNYAVDHYVDEGEILLKSNVVFEVAGVDSKNLKYVDDEGDVRYNQVLVLKINVVDPDDTDTYINDPDSPNSKFTDVEPFYNDTLIDCNSYEIGLEIASQAINLDDVKTSEKAGKIEKESDATPIITVNPNNSPIKGGSSDSIMSDGSYSHVNNLQNIMDLYRKNKLMYIQLSTLCERL
jgi:hypothetical protein